jgi:hypothetical protein
VKIVSFDSTHDFDHHLLLSSYERLGPAASQASELLRQRERAFAKPDRLRGFDHSEFVHSRRKRAIDFVL